MKHQAITEMVEVLQQALPIFTVEYDETSEDFDAARLTFRLQRANRTEHVLKIAKELLEDNSPAAILARLDTFRWKEELVRAGRNPLILTGMSLQPATPMLKDCS